MYLKKIEGSILLVVFNLILIVSLVIISLRKDLFIFHKIVEKNLNETKDFYDLEKALFKSFMLKDELKEGQVIINNKIYKFFVADLGCINDNFSSYCNNHYLLTVFGNNGKSIDVRYLVKNLSENDKILKNHWVKKELISFRYYVRNMV